MKYFFKALGNFANFNGRARRKEYWWFVVYSTIFAFVAYGTDLFLFMKSADSIWVKLQFGPICTVLGLLLLLPGVSVAVRRMHDVNKSGWWVLIELIPFLGQAYFLYLTLIEGTKGSNDYGVDPKK